MKKIILVVLSSVLVFGYVLGIRQLENFVSNEAVKALPKFITFKQISINPLSSIVLREVKVNDVSFPSANIFTAAKIKIKFNPLKGIQAKDFSAITSLTMDKPIVKVKHFHNDTFNFIEIIEKLNLPSDNTKELPDMDFDIKIKDGTIEYYDERGFGAKPLRTPEVNTAYNVNTLIKYKNGETKIDNFYANLNQERNKVFVSGSLNSKDYWFKVKASNCEITKEVNYFIPLKEINIKNAEGDLQLILKTNEVKQKTDLPIRFDVEYKSKNTLLKMDMLTKDILINEGVLLVNNKGVFLNNLVAQVEGEKFNVNGKIDDFYKLGININSKKTNMERVEKFLPFLQSLKLRGSARTDVNIFTNNAGKVVISGNVEDYVGKVIGYSLDKGTVSFVFVDNKVDLILPEVNAYNGVGRGYGYVEMKSGFPPYVSMVVDIRGIELYQYFKSEHFNGKIDLALRIDSFTEGLNGVVDIVGNGAKVFGQDLLQARMYWQAELDRTVFADNSFAVVNNSDSVIKLEGFLKKDNSFFVAIAPSALDINNFYFFYTNTGNYRAKTVVEGAVSGVYDDAFRKDPVARISGNIFGNVDLFEVITPQMSMKGKMEATFDKGLTVSASLKNKRSSLAIKARVEDKKMKRLNIKATAMDLAVAKSFVKPVAIDYKGMVSCDITIFPDNNKLFLKGQGVTGSVYLSKAVVSSQNIDLFDGQICITGDTAVFNKARFINTSTDVLLSGEYRATSDFSVSIDRGVASNQGWKTFPTGLRGEIKNIRGKAKNSKGKITFDFNAAFTDVFFRGVFLPDARGRFVMDKDKFIFEEVTVEHFKDSYFVSGSVYLKRLASGINPFDVNVRVIQGELENIFDLYNSIQINWRNKSDLVNKESKSKVNIFDSYNSLLKKEAKNLYSVRGENISQAIETLKVLDQSSVSAFMPGIYGTLKGDLHVSYLDDLLLFSDLTLKDGRYQFMSAKEVKLLSVLKGNFFDVSVRANSARLMNKNFDQLSLFAKYFPDKDQVEIVNFYAKINEHRTSDILKGKINFKDAMKDIPNDQALDLYLFLNKDDIDVLTVFNKTFAKISNQGSILFHITGPFIKPIINAEEATLRDFELAFAPTFMLRTPMKIASADLLVKDSKISFPKDMKIQWQGLDTAGKINEFICNGEIVFPGFLEKFAGILFDLDININPMSLQLDIKDLFQGKVRISDTSLKGRYTVAMKKDLVEEQVKDVLTEKEQGPVFRTRAFAESGIYRLPVGVGGQGGLTEFKPPLLLDVKLSLGKDIQIAQKSSDQDINRWFTNINFVFDERPELLKVQGSLNTIDSEGLFKFSSGKIVFMNKIFNLMDRQKQREIFGAGSAEIGDNYVEVKMEQHPIFTDKRKATPYFNMKTFSEVQKPVTVTDSTTYEDHLFVIFIKGPINDLASFSIEHYKKGTSGYALAQARIYLSDMTPDQMDTVLSYLVPAVFRPDFYKSIMQQGLADNQEANSMLREYSASQINMWIDQQLQPFEQEIARNMGLYDVNIKHDLGGELVNATKVFQHREDRAYTDAQDNSLSVEYVKDLFFKRFFVKVKTGISQDPTKPLLNMSQYELAWFLNDYLSLNYGNYNLNNIDTTYGAFSINANFIF